MANVEKNLATWRTEFYLMPSLVAGEDGYQTGVVLRCLRTQKDAPQRGGQVGADLSATLYGFSIKGARLPVLVAVAPERRGRRGIP